jgi:hypothetical protein
MDGWIGVRLGGIAFLHWDDSGWLEMGMAYIVKQKG